MRTLAIIDDEDRIRRGFEKILERIDVPNQLAGSFGSSLEAYGKIAALPSGSLDVVVTDIRMPEMDGLQLVSRLRRVHPNLKFIILSGHGNFEYAPQAIRYGAVEYMLKPLDVRVLKGILRKFSHEDEVQDAPTNGKPSSSRTGPAGSPCDRPVHRVARQVKDKSDSQFQRDIPLQELADDVSFSPSHPTAFTGKAHPCPSACPPESYMQVVKITSKDDWKWSVCRI